VKCSFEGNECSGKLNRNVCFKYIYRQFQQILPHHSQTRRLCLHLLSFLFGEKLKRDVREGLQKERYIVHQQEREDRERVRV
jgi:hypothetical protein